MRKAAILWLLFLNLTRASATEAPAFVVTRLADGVYAAIARNGGSAGGNAGFVVGSTGVVIVDSFADSVSARALLGEVRKVTNLPIRFVVNTHHHFDHVGGNEVLAKEGATILGHHNMRRWVRTENLRLFGPEIGPETKAKIESLVLPEIAISGAVDIFLGTRVIQVRHMLGHTGGDLVIVVQDANVVFAGDLIWERHIPNLIDADMDAWVGTLDHLMARYPSAKFVPGHGNVTSVDGVRNFHEYLGDLRRAVKLAQSSGRAGESLSESVYPQIKEKYGSWGFFDYFARSNISRTAATLGGNAVVPVATDIDAK